jgi:hypothetical protein
MKKKNIKVKKGNGDISITIENNLNANNKQINHQPIKRRRRKKVEDTEEINDETPQQTPPEDTEELPSYIKPGPVGAFKIWQNAMDSYNTTVPMNQAQQLGLVPSTPTQPALTAPSTPSTQSSPEKPLTLENFKQVLSMMREERQRPPAEWGRNLIDDYDDEPRMPSSPASFSTFSTLSKPNYLEDDMDFANELDNSVAEVYGLDPKDPETKETSKEVQRILNKARAGVATSQAKRMGTIHGRQKKLPKDIKKTDAYMKYKDTEAYKMAYNKAYNEHLSSEADEDEDEIPVAGRTRAGKKKVQISDDLKSGVTDRSRQRESERLKREIDELNKQMPDLGDFENWNEEEELAKAGLTPIKTSRASLDAINNSSLKK